MRGFIVFVVAVTGCARTVSPGESPCARDASCVASDAATGETTSDDRPDAVDAPSTPDPWCARFATLTPGAGAVTGIVPTFVHADGNACAAVHANDATGAWRVEIPARSVLQLSGRTESSSAQVEISDTCPVSACRLAFLTPAGEGSTFEVNPTDTPRALFLRVGTNNPNGGGRYTLRAETSRLQPGALCDTALRAGLDTRIEGDTANGAPLPDAPARRRQFYRITVPPHRVAEVTLAEDRADGLALQSWLTCDDVALGERATVRSAHPVIANTLPLTLPNGTDAPQDQVFTVTTDRGPTRYALRTGLRRPVASTLCASATPVQDGTVLRAQSLADTTDLPPDCRGSTRTPLGGAHFYRARVPPRATLGVTVSGLGGFYMSVHEGCAATSACLAATFFPNPSSGNRWTNTTASPQDVIISVQAERYETAEFELAIALR